MSRDSLEKLFSNIVINIANSLINLIKKPSLFSKSKFKYLSSVGEFFSAINPLLYIGLVLYLIISIVLGIILILADLLAYGTK